VKTSFGSFQYSIMALVALDLVAAMLCSLIMETEKRFHAATRS
jgi:hypothetical protein